MDYEVARTFNWPAIILSVISVCIILWVVIELSKSYKDYKRGFRDQKKSRLKQWLSFNLKDNVAGALIFGFMGFLLIACITTLPYTVDQTKAIENIKQSYGITVERSKDRLICDYFIPDFDCVNRFEYKVLDSEKAPEVILVEFEEYKEPKIVKRYSITEENID